MNLRKLTSLLFFSLFLISCANTDYSDTSFGLPKVEGTDLDSLYAVENLSLKTLTLAPVKVSYKHNRDNHVIYDDEDFELRESDLKILQSRAEKAFAKHFAVQGPYTLEIHFDELQLTAPLREDSAIAKTFVEETGYVTLRGVVRSKGVDSKVVASFVDKVTLGQHRDHLDPQRHSSVLFWHDLQMTLNRVASKLDRAIN